MAAHGTQKLFGWFGGYGPKGTGGFFESIGIKPGVMMAVVAGLIELGGGCSSPLVYGQKLAQLLLLLQ